MFLRVENGTWPNLDSRWEVEAVRRVWDWEKPLRALQYNRVKQNPLGQIYSKFHQFLYLGCTNHHRTFHMVINSLTNTPVSFMNSSCIWSQCTYFCPKLPIISEQINLSSCHLLNFTLYLLDVTFFCDSFYKLHSLEQRPKTIDPHRLSVLEENEGQKWADIKMLYLDIFNWTTIIDFIMSFFFLLMPHTSTTLSLFSPTLF